MIGGVALFAFLVDPPDFLVDKKKTIKHSNQPLPLFIFVLDWIYFSFGLFVPMCA
jgi:hypothetical protein